MNMRTSDAHVPYTLNVTVSFRAILTKTKGTSPDSLFLNAASVETLGPLVKQISELGIKLPLYGFAYPSVPTFLKSYAQFCEGIVFISPQEIDERSETAAQFKTLFTKHAGASPNIPFVAATAYDGATALVSALESSTKGDPDTTIAALNTYNAPGVLGQIRFDQNGDAIGISYVLNTIKNGSVEPLKVD